MPPARDIRHISADLGPNLGHDRNSARIVANEAAELGLGNAERQPTVTDHLGLTRTLPLHGHWGHPPSRDTRQLHREIVQQICKDNGSTGVTSAAPAPAKLDLGREYFRARMTSLSC